MLGFLSPVQTVAHLQELGASQVFVWGSYPNPVCRTSACLLSSVLNK